jgi:hypothetical protein
MKTSLFLIGQLREFRECADNIVKNLVDPTNSDVYLYFSSNNDKDIQDVLNIYRPKSYICGVDPYIEIPEICFERERYQNSQNVKNIFQMWRKIKKCFDIIPNKYDWITKFRFDCKLNIKLDEEFFTNLDSNSFNIPIGGDWNGINDMMCIAIYKHMKYYCNLYNFLIPYGTSSPFCFGYEELVKFHLRYKSLNRFPCDVYLRKNFDGTVEERKFNL